MSLMRLCDAGLEFILFLYYTLQQNPKKFLLYRTILIFLSISIRLKPRNNFSFIWIEFVYMSFWILYVVFK